MDVDLNTYKYHAFSNKENKINYGEINTPFSLINQMLDMMPVDIFKNKELKWLDPGCGYGYFSIILFKRLFSGLSDVIVDKEERKQYIIKNMIWMIEINHEHIKNLKHIFGEHANIINHDFIDYNFSLQFDVILGNPPYNCNGQKKVPTNNALSKKDDGYTAWFYFVRKSMSILKTNGYLLFIIPSIWMKPDKAKIYDYMLQFKILKLHSLTNTQTNKIFSGNAQTPTCYFLLQNTTPNEYISLYDTSLSAYVDYILKPQIPIPVFGTSVINKLRDYTNNIGNLSVIKTNTLSKKISVNSDHSKSFNFKNIKTCTLNGINPKLVIEYTNAEGPYYNVPKLVLAHKMYGFPYYDKKGEFGISNRDNYVIVNKTHEEFLQLRDFFSTKFALYLFEATRYRMKYLEKYIFELIPDITKIHDFPNTINDDSLFAFFSINEKERKSILELHKKSYNFIPSL